MELVKAAHGSCDDTGTMENKTWIRILAKGSRSACDFHNAGLQIHVGRRLDYIRGGHYTITHTELVENIIGRHRNACRIPCILHLG